jgi:opacity protein-like surface antigen
MTLVLLAATAAHAQEDRSFGVTMGYPGSIGVLWHATPRVAVRPALAFSHSGSDDTSFNALDGSVLTASISGIIYLQPAGPFRMYMSPRYTYGRFRTSTSTSIDVPTLSPTLGLTTETITISSKSKRHEHGGAGLVGAEYRPGDRFAVFGEAGLQYSRSSSDTTTGTLPIGTDLPTRWMVGTTGGVGVTVYF